MRKAISILCLIAFSTMGLRASATVTEPGGVSFPDTFGVIVPEYAVNNCMHWNGSDDSGAGCNRSLTSPLSVYPAYHHLVVNLGTPAHYYPWQDWARHLYDGYVYAEEKLSALGFDLELREHNRTDFINFGVCSEQYGTSCQHELTIEYAGYAQNKTIYEIRYAQQFDPDNTNAHAVMDIQFDSGPVYGYYHDPGVPNPTRSQHPWVWASAKIYDDSVWDQGGTYNEKRCKIVKATARAIFAAAGFGDAGVGTLDLLDWQVGNAGVGSECFDNNSSDTFSVPQSYGNQIILRDN